MQYTFCDLPGKLALILFICKEIEWVVHSYRTNSHEVTAEKVDETLCVGLTHFHRFSPTEMRAWGKYSWWIQGRSVTKKNILLLSPVTRYPYDLFKCGITKKIRISRDFFLSRPFVEIKNSWKFGDVNDDLCLWRTIMNPYFCPISLMIQKNPLGFQ